jgi:hypothetical protein
MICTARAPLSAALMISFMCAASPGAAQPNPKGAPSGSASDQAGQFFDQGTALYRQKRWAEAEAAFQKAWDLQQRFDVAANLGDCELHVGQKREAAEHLGYAVRQFPISGKDALRERLMQRYREAREQVGTIAVRVNVKGAEVWVDGRPVGFSPLDQEVFVEPGTRHSVEAKLAGYEAAQQSEQLVKGEFIRVTLTMVKKEGAAALPAAPAPPTASGSALPPRLPPVEKEATGPRKEVLIGGGVTAGAALVGGVVFSVLSNGKVSDAEAKGGWNPCYGSTTPVPNRCPELHKLRLEAAMFGNLAFWSFLGAGAVGAGTVVYALITPKRAQAPAAVRIVPGVMAYGGGMVLSGQW